MNLFYLFLFIAATFSVPIVWRTFRKASPAQRRQMVVAGIGAVAVAMVMILLYVARR